MTWVWLAAGGGAAVALLLWSLLAVASAADDALADLDRDDGEDRSR